MSLILILNFLYIHIMFIIIIKVFFDVILVGSLYMLLEIDNFKFFFLFFFF